MKKIIISLFILLGLVSAYGMPLTICGSSSATGTSCTSYESQTTSSNSSHVGDSTDNWYGGQTYKAPANISVCKVILELKAAGDPAGDNYTYKVYIYDLDGTSLDTLQGSSDAVDANNSWSDDTQEFDFSTSVSLTSGTLYGIVLARADGGGADSTDYVKIRFNSSDSSPLDHADEDFHRWKSDKSQNAEYDGYDIYLEVYNES